MVGIEYGAKGIKNIAQKILRRAAQILFFSFQFDFTWKRFFFSFSTLYVLFLRVFVSYNNNGASAP